MSVSTDITPDKILSTINAINEFVVSITNYYNTVTTSIKSDEVFDSVTTLISNINKVNLLLSDFKINLDIPLINTVNRTHENYLLLIEIINNNKYKFIEFLTNTLNNLTSIIKSLSITDSKNIQQINEKYITLYVKIGSMLSLNIFNTFISNVDKNNLKKPMLDLINTANYIDNEYDNLEKEIKLLTEKENEITLLLNKLMRLSSKNLPITEELQTNYDIKINEYTEFSNSVYTAINETVKIAQEAVKIEKEVTITENIDIINKAKKEKEAIIIFLTTIETNVKLKFKIVSIKKQILAKYVILENYINLKKKKEEEEVEKAREENKDVSILEEKVKKTEEKVKKTEEAVKKADEAVKEAEKEAEKAEKEAEEVEKEAKKEAKKAEKEADEAVKEAEKADEAVKEAEKEADEAVKEAEKADEAIKEAEKNKKILIIEEKNEKKKLSIKNAEEAIKNAENIVVKTKIEVLNIEIEIEAEGKKIGELEKEIGEVKKEIGEVEKEIGKVEKEIGKVDTEIGKDIVITKEVDKNIEILKIKSDLEENKADLEDKKNLKNLVKIKANKDIEEIKKNITKLKNEIIKKIKETKLNEKKEKLKEKEEKLNEKKEKLKENKEKLDKLLIFKEHITNKLFIIMCDIFDINGYLSVYFASLLCFKKSYDLMIIVPERLGINYNEDFNNEDFKKDDNKGYNYNSSIIESTIAIKKGASLINKIYEETDNQLKHDKTKGIKPTLYIIRGAVNELNNISINTEKIIKYDKLENEDNKKIYTHYTVKEENDLLNMLSQEPEKFTTILDNYNGNDIYMNINGSCATFNLLSSNLQTKLTTNNIYISNGIDYDDSNSFSLNQQQYFSLNQFYSNEGFKNILTYKDNLNFITDKIEKKLITDITKVNNLIKTLIDNYKDEKITNNLISIIIQLLVINNKGEIEEKNKKLYYDKEKSYAIVHDKAIDDITNLTETDINTYNYKTEDILKEFFELV